MSTNTPTPIEGTASLKEIVQTAGRIGDLIPAETPALGVGACLFYLFTTFSGKFPEPDKFLEFAHTASDYLALVTLDITSSTIIAPGSDKVH